MSHINTRIGCIARRQYWLGGFALSPNRESLNAPSDSGDDKSSNAPSNSGDDDKMTTLEWFTLCPSWQKGEVAMSS